MSSSGPDLDKSMRRYEAVAGRYDRAMRRSARWRQLAVGRLLMGPGETVIDVACGTGLNFAALQTTVGRRGRIIGLDASPEMISLARDRVARHGWENVELIEAPVEAAEFAGDADAALFSFTHDVLQSPLAIDNVVSHLGRGARIASVGAKFAPRWALPVNLGVRLIARRFVTTFEGMRRPWDLLEPYAEELLVESLALGGAYVAWGRLADPASGTTWSKLTAT